MLLFLQYIVSFSLYRKVAFKKYLPYCQATHNHIPQKSGMKFHKLIVIHRHGDRTPMKRFTNIKEECVNCNISKKIKSLETYTIDSCYKTKCEDGALTAKGYFQMLQLGKFIRENYLQNFNDISLDDLSLRATSVIRTNTSLNGIVTGIFVEKSIFDVIPQTDEKLDEQLDLKQDAQSNEQPDKESDKTPYKDNYKVTFGQRISFLIPSNKNESLIGYKTCPRLTHILALPSKKSFKNITKKKNIQVITDNYLYSICRNSDLDCSKTSCDPEESERLVEGSFRTWTYQSILLKAHSNIRKFMFGKFARDLLELLRNSKKVSIISAHDNSLSYILAGLGTDILERPPLASAIFIEVWSLNSVKYIRILFNNFVCITDIDKSTNIPYEKFIRYLEKSTASEKELIDECKEL